jgi:hypothetical protein
LPARAHAKEASASNGAQFGSLDLRCDKSFRIHATVGTWQKNGSALKLRAEGHEMVFTISKDGKLLSGGKPAYVRS